MNALGLIVLRASPAALSQDCMVVCHHALKWLGVLRHADKRSQGGQKATPMQFPGAYRDAASEDADLSKGSRLRTGALESACKRC